MTTNSTPVTVTDNDAGTKYGLSANEWKRLGEGLASCIADQFIADGDIRPKGKSTRQVALQALKLMRKRLDEGRVPSLFPRFDLDILDAAKKFRSKGKYREACLFYATWFEHRVNFIVTRQRFALTDAESQQMVREVSLIGKLAWLLPALGFKRVAAAHLKTLRQLVEARNAFVHFKYKYNSDHEDEEDKRLKSLLKKVERARISFEAYEKKQLYSGLQGFLSNTLKPHPEKNRAVRKNK
jgi:hypothetical protein